MLRDTGRIGVPKRLVIGGKVFREPRSVSEQGANARLCRRTRVRRLDSHAKSWAALAPREYTARNCSANGGNMDGLSQSCHDKHSFRAKAFRLLPTYIVPYIPTFCQ